MGAGRGGGSLAGSIQVGRWGSSGERGSFIYSLSHRARFGYGRGFCTFLLPSKKDQNFRVMDLELCRLPLSCP